MKQVVNEFSRPLQVDRVPALAVTNALPPMKRNAPPWQSALSFQKFIPWVGC